MTYKIRNKFPNFTTIAFHAVFTIFIIPIVFSYSQEINEQDIPPVDIEFMAIGDSILGEEINISLTVLPHEDMHLDISCYVPIGVEVIESEDIKIHTFQVLNEFGINKYFEKVELFVGHANANLIKKFNFRVMLHDSNPYNLIAEVMPLEKWNIKQQNFILEVGQ